MYSPKIIHLLTGTSSPRAAALIPKLSLVEGLWSLLPYLRTKPRGGAGADFVKTEGVLMGETNRTGD